MKRYLPFAIIAIVLCSAIVVAALLLRAPKKTTSLSSTPSSGSSSTNNPGSTQSGANPPRAKGDANAPVTIEEFGDLQCPPCAALEPELQKLEKEYGARLRIVFRHFPLTQMHPYALEAAQAAEAAGEQDAFWPMHDALYGDQGRLEDPHLWARAERLGLDVGRFHRDARSEAVRDRVQAHFRSGIRAGVATTPTLFLPDGEKISGRPGEDVWQKLAA